MFSKFVKLVVSNLGEMASHFSEEPTAMEEQTNSQHSSQDLRDSAEVDLGAAPPTSDKMIRWNLMDQLPLEMLATIFGNLDLEDLTAIPAVSKKWREAALQENLWKEMCTRRIPGGISDRILREKEEDGVSWKEYLRRRLLRHVLPYLVIGAEGDPKRLADVHKILTEQGLKNVQVFNAKDACPKLSFLQDFSAVLCFSYFGFGNAVGLGNALSKYVDGGGGVIIMCYANCGLGNSLKGDWEKRGFDPIIPKDTSRPTGPKSLGKILISDHPVLEGVKTFDGGHQNSHSRGELNTGAQLIASWNHDAPLVVEQDAKTRGKILCLNFYPPTSRVASYERSPGTDGDKMMANALFYCSALCKRYPYENSATASEESDMSDTECMMRCSSEENLMDYAKTPSIQF